MKAAVELLYTTDNMLGVPGSLFQEEQTLSLAFILANRNDNVNNKSKDHPYPQHDC